MKAYTDLEQSKKLAEILPIESADMCYRPYKEEGGISDYQATLCPHKTASWIGVPCWSLAALHGILTENKICHYDNRYYCQYISEGDEFPAYSTSEYNNPIDACYEMIIKLHEQNLL